jgi:dihydroorotate dehydrogenase electron transfer subunit
MTRIHGRFRVEDHRASAGSTRLLTVAAPDIADRGRPGQFVLIRVGGDRPDQGPLLSRPFSIHRFGPDGRISFLYRIVGSGTRRLAEVRAGETVDLLGPLGRGFDVDPPPESAYLAAGGMGLAPLTGLAETLAGRTRIQLFYGEQTAESVCRADYMDQCGWDRVVCTDDGTAGRMGLVTAALAEALADRPAPIFACGPWAMLAETVRLARTYEVPVQVSLEARMACGLGACLGCAVELDEPNPAGPVYARVCADGPVFEGERIKWTTRPT